jgi:hypothetical protein
VNIAKYKETLVLQGLRGELVDKFASAVTSVADDKQKQYEITSNRKNHVQNNECLVVQRFVQTVQQYFEGGQDSLLGQQCRNLKV